MARAALLLFPLSQEQLGASWVQLLPKPCWTTRSCRQCLGVPHKDRIEHSSTELTARPCLVWAKIRNAVGESSCSRCGDAQKNKSSHCSQPAGEIPQKTAACRQPQSLELHSGDKKAESCYRGNPWGLIFSSPVLHPFEWSSGFKPGAGRAKSAWEQLFPLHESIGTIPVTSGPSGTFSAFWSAIVSFPNVLGKLPRTCHLLS